MRTLYMRTQLLFETRNYSFNQEECENTDFDEEFNNSMQWVQRQRKTLKNQWKEEAYMYRPARQKSDEFIILFDYLNEKRSVVKRLKERLKAPNNWCIHSLNLNVQLMKLEKELNERFKDIAVLLKDNALIESYAEKNGDTRNMKSIKYFEGLESGAYWFGRQDLRTNTWQDYRNTNTCQELRNNLMSTLREVRSQIFACVEEQDEQTLSSRGHHFYDPTEIHRNSSNLELKNYWGVDEVHEHKTITNLTENSPKDSSLVEEKFFDDEESCIDQTEITEEDEKFFNSSDHDFIESGVNWFENQDLLTNFWQKYRNCFITGFVDEQTLSTRGQNFFDGEKSPDITDPTPIHRDTSNFELKMSWVVAEVYEYITNLTENSSKDSSLVEEKSSEDDENCFEQTEITEEDEKFSYSSDHEFHISKSEHAVEMVIQSEPEKKLTHSNGFEEPARVERIYYKNCNQIFHSFIFKILLVIILASAVPVECSTYRRNMKFTDGSHLMNNMVPIQLKEKTTFENIIHCVSCNHKCHSFVREKEIERDNNLTEIIECHIKYYYLPVFVAHGKHDGSSFGMIPVQVKFRCVTRNSNDRHHCPPINQHREGNNKIKAIIEGFIIYAVAISVALRGIIGHDGSSFLFSLMVSGLTFCFVIGFPVTALLCQLKIPLLWIFIKMINSLDCILFVFKTFDQRYVWMEYMCALECYLKEYLQKSSLDEVLSEPIEEVNCLKNEEDFNTEEEYPEMQRNDCDWNNVEVIHLDQTKKLSKNVFIRAEEEIQSMKKIGKEDLLMEEAIPNTEHLFDIGTHFTEIRPVSFKPFDIFEEDEDLELQENDFSTDREKDGYMDDQRSYQGDIHYTTSESNENPKVHFIADYDENENNFQVLIPPINQTLGSSQPLPDLNDNVIGFGEDDFPKEELKLKLQVVPSPSQILFEQTNVKVVEQQTKLTKFEDCRNDSFFNLKLKVKEDKPKRRELYLRCTEDYFDMFAKAPKKYDAAVRQTVRNYTWLRDLPVPEIDITLAYFETNVASNVPSFEPLMSIIDQIADGTPPTPHISMRYELLRFCTLRSYPKENKPYLIKLAEAGFYYASDGDGVVCYCCGVRRYNWVAEDNPMKIHERINPNCKYLRKNEEVNIPVKYFGPFSKSLMAIMDIPEPRERSEQSEDVNNDWAPERVRSPASAQQNRTNEAGANSLGINTAVPKHTQYATKTAREGSYSGWPDSASHTPQELADAGFFYAGFGDCVRCFYCGIGLRHWTKEDNPWIEHARWSRNCVFVKQKKGEEFVNLVQLAVQYSQDNEAQSNTSAGNQLPAQEIERILLSDAAQSVLEMGYQPRIIKKAIEEILRQNADTKITAQLLMEKVLEIEEAKNPPQAAPAPEPATAPAPARPKAKPASQTAKPEISKPVESAQAAVESKSEETPEAAKTSLERKDKGESGEEASQDPKAIKAENEQLKEQTLCKVCLDNTVCIVFLPCGHLVTCADCAPAMRKCPICRALVKGTVRTYMS